jgi:transcriptional regulator with XRE-family HTH domain
MNKNNKLRQVLFEAEMTQRELADRTNIPEAYISFYIHGRFILDTDQKRIIAKVLKKPQKELFEDE